MSALRDGSIVRVCIGCGRVVNDDSKGWCCTESELDSVRITAVYPPIPDPNSDWSATSVDYDASYEGEEEGYRGSHPIGHGRTPELALAEYLALQGVEL